jgi:hypothetical protein
MISRKEKKTIIDKIKLILKIKNQDVYTIKVSENNKDTGEILSIDSYHLRFDITGKLIIYKEFGGYSIYRVSFKQLISCKGYTEEESIANLELFLDQELIELV